MTTKEYLQQAYRLDKRINSHIKELEELKSMAAAFLPRRSQRTRYRPHPAETRRMCRP